MTHPEMSWLPSRLVPFFAALLLALPGVGHGAAYLFCHGMGRVVDKCCCPSVDRAPAAMDEGCGATVQAPDCCQRVEPGSGTAAAASRDKAGLDDFVTPSAAASPLVIIASERFERDVILQPVEARAPRPRGPPLFIANCSFLI
jgi:hypothetical protein